MNTTTKTKKTHTPEELRVAKETLQVLTIARNRIKRGDATFICHAIEEACVKLDFGWHSERGRRLKKLVNKAIDNCYTMNNWVAKQLNIDVDMIDRDEMRQRRVMFLTNWMAAIRKEYGVKA